MNHDIQIEVRGENMQNALRRQNSLPKQDQIDDILKEFGCDKVIEPDLGLYIDNLLVQWLTSPETKTLISDLLSGKSIEKSRKGSNKQKTHTNSKSDSDTNQQNSLQNPNTLQNSSFNNHSRNNSSEQDSESNFDNCLSPRSTATGIKLPAKANAAITTTNSEQNASQNSPRKDRNNTTTPSLLHLPKPVTRTSSNANRSSLSASFKVQNNNKNNSSTPAVVPKFYFPFGQKNSEISVEDELDKVRDAFSQLPGGKIARLKDMDKIAEACGCPKYWRRALFNACGGHRAGQITGDHFIKFWKNIIENYHDTASRFVAVVSSNRKNKEAKSITNKNLSNRYKSKNNQKQENQSDNNPKSDNNNKLSDNYLEFHDFMPVIQDIVDSHPGLVFLGQAPEFHSRYVQTVICRIFYHVNRSWSGKITITELRSAHGEDFLRDLERLSDEDDINQLKQFFSYEHFYVIYCKFWELDPDHDLIINDHDLLDYHGAALTSRVVERLMSGCVTRWSGSDSGKRTMGYRELLKLTNFDIMRIIL